MIANSANSANSALPVRSFLNTDSNDGSSVISDDSRDSVNASPKTQKMSK